MKTRTRIAKRSPAAKADDGTHRLEDIDVDEISTVDRGANKRKFLVVKGDAADAEDAPKSDDRLVALRDLCKSAVDMLTDAEKLETPDEIAGALGKVLKALSPVPAADDKEPAADGKEPAAKAGDADGGEEPAADGDGDTPGDGVEKAGSAHWMSTMQGMFDQLHSTIESVQEGGPARPASDLGVGTQPDAEMVGKVSDLFDGIKDITKSLDGVRETVASLKKRVSDQNVEIRSLQSGVDLPASSQSGGKTGVTKGDETHWPLDMNRPDMG